MTSHRSVRSVLITGKKQHGDRNRGRTDYYVNYIKDRRLLQGELYQHSLRSRA